MNRNGPFAPASPASAKESHLVAAPAISLPKGGGAIRGIGEKFAANPVTGTAAVTIPIATSPGRSGFAPQLALTYDSGSGNGPFGLGWSLGLAQIARKTDKGLPRYMDDVDSDVFVLSGAEDLVLVFRQDAAGVWLRDANGRLVVHEDERAVAGVAYRVRRYRPRIEGLFARIERWSRVAEPGDVHWRSISKDNVLTVYGGDTNSRIADPKDTSRIFSWLICDTRDDKGNGVRYRYKPEDGVGVDMLGANERNRGARNDVRRTANRHIKHIYYGNRIPLLDGAGGRPPFVDEVEIANQIVDGHWMFEVVFDYGEHDADAPAPSDPGEWTARSDPFSTYRSGFEVRTTRRCHRVLMFHHFADEPDVGVDCLVRSTDFVHSDAQVSANDARRFIYTFLRAISHTSYRRTAAGYAKRSLPPVEFEYSEPIVQDAVHDVEADSLENLPFGVDGTTYQWTDLHGEGIPGVLTEQAGAWFYKRNISPIGEYGVLLAPVERVALTPNLAFAGGSAQFMDLAGDGQSDLVALDGAMPGFYEHDDGEGWEGFRALPSRVNHTMRDPNLRFVDLDGDGRADVLITEGDAFVWHRSLGEDGFGPAQRVVQELDEENGPRVVFADEEQAIYLADLSGDGLTDLVRIRNGDVCYWPNVGYGRFGAKITMDHAPQFDNPDQFDRKRIRLADIDGSGASDIIYLHRDGVRLYFNRSGNSWSEAQTLRVFPRVDDVVSIAPADLLGNGTACLVWSSPLSGDAGRQMRYVDLMGGRKPHLLIRVDNNLGAETRIEYASSVKFYLRDKRAGKPWITRLPFPVHAVEKVETYDHISRSRFVTRYAYHHGYFDDAEREFRGFGMVEQFDAEQFSALTDSSDFPVGDNVAAESHVPPVHTKTWFHTGIYLGGERVSDYFAGLLSTTDAGEYFREPGLTGAEAQALLLPDTILPSDLTLDEEREACRALKGSMLRQEVYALDGSDKEAFPYTVTEQTFTIRRLQPRAENPHGVFFTHGREAINLHYERHPSDPRVQHALTLEVDASGNVLKEAAVAYGRRTSIAVIDAQGAVHQVPNPGLMALDPLDRTKQTATLATYTENTVTNSVDTDAAYRTPLSCETRTFELTGYVPTGAGGRYQPADLVEVDPLINGRLRHAFLGEDSYEATSAGPRRRRLIEVVRILYRGDDMVSLLSLGSVASLALPGESYRLAFTPGLLAKVFQRSDANHAPEDLLSDPSAVLDGVSGDRGGYVKSETLELDGRFPASDDDGFWWMPSGRSFFSPDPDENAAPAARAAAERATALAHFFLPRRFRDPFGRDTVVDYDGPSAAVAPHYDLLVTRTSDPVGNRVTVEANDYRVLQPRLVSDANGNQTGVAFDTFGLVAGTAVMGKPLPAKVEGDSLLAFTADLTPAEIDQFHAAPDPHTMSATLLQNATTRIVYDVDCFRRSRDAHPEDAAAWTPTFAATLARESHASDQVPGAVLAIQVAFSYSDGTGREIQKKAQAERVQTGGSIAPPRWICGGWIIFNNKGKPVRQYEPFFSALHAFEFGVQAGVSPVAFYDPVGRAVATLHPNDSYEKVAFDAWQQTTYDVNDTAAPRNAETGDPRTDADISGYVEQYFAANAGDVAHPWTTWYDQRRLGALGPREQQAALKASAHADTPTTAHLDALGRPFLTLARNRVVCAGHPLDGSEDVVATRIDVDIEGNQREVRDTITAARDDQGNNVRDTRGRIVMRYAYDMLGNRIHQLSMEAGARWTLNDVAGKPIRAWDDRGHNVVWLYDAVRRPVEQRVSGTTNRSDVRTRNGDVLVDKIEYGETQPNADAHNLRTRIYRHFDSAGVATNAAPRPVDNQREAYDFKGNLLRSTRQLVSDYEAIPDWSQAPALDDETFSSSTRYDALNRAVQSIAPHSNLPRSTCNLIQPLFNASNLLRGVDVWLALPAEPAGILDGTVDVPSAVGVRDIDYDAKGQRQRIAYKNGATTCYDYDPFTFRLTELETRRGTAAFPDDAAQPPPAGWPGRYLQSLAYTYDPAGNITHVQDDAQQTIYFKNHRVEPSNDYTYDALYRLIDATGREHLGQSGAIAHSYDDAGRVGLPSGDAAGRFSPYDGTAMGAYTERYVYDAVGNFLETQHRPDAAGVAGWTRAYTYAEDSLIESAGAGSLVKRSNRLSRTTIHPNGGVGVAEPYEHDVHGNMVRMPHLGGGSSDVNMLWDYKDQLRSNGLGGGGTAYYVYDASGQRVRKVWAKSPGLIEERIYLGGWEIFRRHTPHAGGAIDASTATLERETLHVMDDERRIALVETRTLDTTSNGTPPDALIRYQLGNHLGSASLELGDAAQIISYEEYTPYGSSSYQAVRSATEAAKRYRYTGKERDEENGLYYHGARYYAAWLGRWTKPDPAGFIDGTNQYKYVSGNPVTRSDSTGLADEAPPQRVNVVPQEGGGFVDVELNPNNPAGYSSFEEFVSASVGPWTSEGLADAWNGARPDDTYVPQVDWEHDVTGPGWPVGPPGLFPYWNNISLGLVNFSVGGAVNLLSTIGNALLDAVSTPFRLLEDAMGTENYESSMFAMNMLTMGIASPLSMLGKVSRVGATTRVAVTAGVLESEAAKLATLQRVSMEAAQVRRWSEEIGRIHEGIGQALQLTQEERSGNATGQVLEDVAKELLRDAELRGLSAVEALVNLSQGGGPDAAIAAETLNGIGGIKVGIGGDTIGIQEAIERSRRLQARIRGHSINLPKRD